jgi:endonuclease/exonuclease/phosphatase family metal-dependent hydrolase
MVSAATLSNAQYPDTVKIMTYNINAETHTDGDYTDIGDVIKALNPTICGLQKVDSFTVTAAPVYVLKALGSQTGMLYTFSLSYTKNGGAYGNGFLSDSAPKSVRHLAIPKGGASEDRSALEIGITMAGEKVRVIVTHLDYGSDANRTAQLQQIVPWIDSAGKTDPVVIMADFNASATAAPMKVLTDAGFVYVKGTNGVILDSTNNINHILYRPENRWKIIDAGNPKYAASNRNPVWAQMKLLNPANNVAYPQRISKSTTESMVTICGQRIFLELARPSRVSMEVFNASGRKIGVLLEERNLGAGSRSFLIDKKIAYRGIAIIAVKIDGVYTKKTLMYSR